MKVIFFDLEATDLSASWGRILCGSFVELKGTKPYTLRADDPIYKGRNKIDDSKLAKAIKEEIENADIVVGWNSILYDVALLNARLGVAGLPKVMLGEKHASMHIDLMYYAGGQSMKIGSKKLDNVAKFFKVPNQKTALDGETWQLAGTGDVDALNLVVEHCEADVLVLRDLWPHLAGSINKFQFSLGEVWQFLDQIESRRV